MTQQATPSDHVYSTFLGDDAFPIHWESDADKKRFWWYDNLHCPQPISPLWFDVGGWWLTCAYMYQRFGLPFGVDWHARKINGYVYTSVQPREGASAGQVGPYLGAVLPVYGKKFKEWWDDRYLPEVHRNNAMLDGYPVDEVSLPDLMIHVEDALEIQERHFRLHWLLNMAQFAAFTHFKGVFAGAAGGSDADIEGDILLSLEDRNWDSIKALTDLASKVKAHAALSQAFEAEFGAQILKQLEASAEGRAFLETDVRAYQQEYGYHAIYTHEYAFETWVENARPVLDAIKAQIAGGYDVHGEITKTRAKRDAAIAEMWRRVGDSPEKANLQDALETALLMAPLTPDHHFYFDQGTYARLRLVFLAVGRRFVASGVLEEAGDIVYLKYDEIRQLAGQPDGFDAKALVAERKAERQAQYAIPPRNWVGSANHWALYEEPYVGIWGYPGAFEREQQKGNEALDTVQGLGASPGVVEGIARNVASPEEFDSVKQGEIMVCRMTNPAWVVVFTKIKGLVTDSGGVLAHPAVIAREFGLPAVVGTLNATQKIQTGQRIRVNGTTGVVDILG
jgi:phosphohistidine swiveling domain-containing protein